MPQYQHAFEVSFDGIHNALTGFASSAGILGLRISRRVTCADNSGVTTSVAARVRGRLHCARAAVTGTGDGAWIWFIQRTAQSCVALVRRV